MTMVGACLQFASIINGGVLCSFRRVPWRDKLGHKEASGCVSEVTAQGVLTLC